MRSYTGVGSRETPKDVMDWMTALATSLAGDGYTLRSGGAAGADSAFEAGTPLNNREIWIPWNGFNGRQVDGVHYRIPPKDEIEFAEHLASLIHPAWDRCTVGAKALHTRNVFQVLGPSLNQPSEMVIAWAPIVRGRAIGGTATALKLADALSIPCYNVFDPMQKQLLQLQVFG